MYISAIWRLLGRLLNFSSGIIGKRPFLAKSRPETFLETHVCPLAAKSWPGAFWKQISAIWRRRGRLLNFSSGIIGKRPFLAKSWPGSLLEANYCHLAAPLPAIDFLFWDHWETAVFGQILAGNVLAQISAIWRPRGRLWHFFSGPIGKRPVDESKEESIAADEAGLLACPATEGNPSCVWVALGRVCP